MIEDIEIQKLIENSDKLKSELLKYFSQYPIQKNLKSELVLNTFDIAFEHSKAISFLISKTLFTTALAVLRLQFDALVRQVWILHVASNEELEKLSSPLIESNANSINNWIPSTHEMLSAVQEKEPTLHKHLMQFKKYSSKALSSYVHSGFHAIARKKHGFYSNMIVSVLKQSNNLLHMSAFALALEQADSYLIIDIQNIVNIYPECFQLE